MNLEAEVRAIFGLFSRGAFKDGLAKATALHRAVPQLAISNYCVGHGLAAMQQPRKALPFLRKAAQGEPRNVDFLVRYGRTLLDLGKIREAEGVLRRANDLNPWQPIGPYTLGIFYSSIDRFDLAVEYFRQVLDAAIPDNMRYSVTMDWANALVEVGRVPEAEQVLRDALRVPNTRLAALVSLAEISPFAPGSELSVMLDDELAKPNVEPNVRSSLATAKAQCAAAAKDFEAEFEWTRKSKAVLGAPNTVSRFSERVDDTITTFTAEKLTTLCEACGTSDFAPIYIIGMPRSGTTLTEKILSAHSKVGGAGELFLLNNLSDDVLGHGSASKTLAIPDSQVLAALREGAKDVEATMRFLCPGKDRIVDKMPHNFLNVWLMASLFPKAKIIHCIRHPADNYLSGFKASLSTYHSYFDRPEWFIDYYREYCRMMQHWYGVLPKRIHALRYEDLVNHPEREIAALLGYCGLAWDDACLSPEENKARIGTASVLQARSPINNKSVGGWKRYANHLQIVEDALGGGCDFPGMRR